MGGAIGPRIVNVVVATGLVVLGVAGAAWATAITPAGAATPRVTSVYNPPTSGVWEAASDGVVYASGVNYYGSMVGHWLNAPIAGIVATPQGRGYWLFAADGGVFAFGDAAFFGSPAGGGHPLGGTVVGMAATPDGEGYWLVTSDGEVYAYGDAGYYGGAGKMTLNQPIVGIAGSWDGHGYWLAAADGGVFAFGDAPFEGSMAGQPLNQPVVGITQFGDTYWLVSGDGGLFAFDDDNPLTWCGSGVGQGLSGVVGLTFFSDLGLGEGYWLAGSDGATVFLGSYYGPCASTPALDQAAGETPLNATVVGIAAGSNGSMPPYPGGDTFVRRGS